MLRISFHIHYRRQPAGRIGIVTIASILALLLVGSAVALPEPTAAQEAQPADAAGAFALPTGSGRHFYLTEADYSPAAAKSACAAGYHMASLWEILDVSNLVYDYAHPQAHVKADSGQGPPSYWYGWIRTGNDSSGVNAAGTGNCLNWTSSLSTNYGVSVRLSRTWESAPGDIGTWDATSFSCNFVGPVWCVTDIAQYYLPQIER